jgi:hypothetical protein
MKRQLKGCLILLAAAGLLCFMGCGSSGGTTPPPPPVQEGIWTWMGGSQEVDQPGSYGTLGVPAPGNVPGARGWSCTWTDASGNFWLFGGLGWASADADPNLDLNDLWEYSNGEWTWMGGSNQTEPSGVYGTMGTPAPGNVPGGRWEATCFGDSQGNFWLYGGLGIDSTGKRGALADLWRYSNGEWTWMSGSNIAAESGAPGTWPGVAVYGTEGVAAPDNTPGAREVSSGWADPSGNLWLFGGLGRVSDPGSVSSIALGNMNDLWKYSNGIWTWMAGSNQINQMGVYGTLGTPASGNTPGYRTGAASWTDAAGNLWLFGGLGAGVSETCEGCEMSDLWKYSNGEWTWMSGSDQVCQEPGVNGEWTWMGGPDVPGYTGVYGTRGVAAPGDLPPPRDGATTWIDAKGNFWLFGGALVYPYNDLWKYSNGEWTWMSGSDQVCQEPGVYGTLGTPSTANVPGARDGAVGWTDKSGNLWLFGGDIIHCPGYGTGQKYNDLWEYSP